MASKQTSVNLDVGDVVARLENYNRRIYMVSLDALYLNEIWSTFNDADEQRRIIIRSPVNICAAMYEDSVLRSLILIITRLLDPPGKPNILDSRRISFRVVQKLLSLPNVSDEFIERARTSLFAKPELNVQAIRGGIANIHARLHRLDAERPNREQRLRAFRDENIAHELRPSSDRARPLSKYVAGMVSEILAFTEDVHLVVNGSTLGPWPCGDASASTTQLWNAVAAAYPQSE